MSNGFNHITVPWPEWNIVKLLGRGGFGAVYEIERILNNGEKDRCAMKIISIPGDEREIISMRDSGINETGIQKSLLNQKNKVFDEYTNMKKLRGHPNVVQCYDIKDVAHSSGVGWDVFIRMELLTPLKDITSGEFSEKEVVKLGKDICAALVACHSLKDSMVHRDVKPANIFRSDFGNYKLGDFGIARTMDHTTFATAAGSPPFMAPEVDQREAYGKSVDTYSLGLVLYWLMNKKRLPFEPVSGDMTADDAAEARTKRYKGERIPDPLNGSAELKTVIRKATEFKPGNRYQSAQEMLDALEEIKGKSVKENYNSSYQNHSMSDTQSSNESNSFCTERNDNNHSDAGSAGWKDENGSIADIHGYTSGKNPDGTIGEYGEESKKKQSPNADPREREYEKAIEIMVSAKTTDDYKNAMLAFSKLGSYKGSEQLLRQCNDKINNLTGCNKSQQAKRDEKKNHARVIAVLISAFFVLVLFWGKSIHPEYADEFIYRHALIACVIPFASCAALFGVKKGIFTTLASIVLGLYATFDVMLFLVNVGINPDSEAFSVIAVIIFLFVWIWAGKKVSSAANDD